MASYRAVAAGAFGHGRTSCGRQPAFCERCFMGDSLRHALGRPSGALRQVQERGYDSTAIVQAIQAMGATAVILSEVCRKLPRPHDPTLYKLCNRIERCFSRLKHFRRLATRYCKRPVCFHATVALACAWLHLIKYVNTVQLLCMTPEDGQGLKTSEENISLFEKSVTICAIGKCIRKMKVLDDVLSENGRVRRSNLGCRLYR